MSAKPKKKYISDEEYLELEEFSLIKNEYFNGEIFAMAGASERHNNIAGNIYADIHLQIKKSPCKVYQNDMRIFIEKTGLYTYPDVVVVCEKPQLKKYKGLENLQNPILIVEVLSPTTADYDKGAKFDHYRTLESLKEYVLVWQDKIRVARYTKHTDSSWLLTDVFGDSAQVILDSINSKISMVDIYDKVEFE